MSDINPNNIKVGDTIYVEEAWEDEAGNYHDEYAKVKAIDNDGYLTLKFKNPRPSVNKWCEGFDYYAKDYKPEKASSEES